MENSILDRLLDYIAEHQLKDGDALPPERTLAEALNVSRRELRSSLASLEASGRVWRGVGRGTYLGARPLKFAPTLRGLRAGASPADIAEMRLLFEPALAQLAATKASRDDLLELEKCARKNAAAKNDEEWQQWDHRFHLLIGQATRNPALISLMEVINGMRVKPDVREKTSAQETRSYFAAQHQEIVSAMKARDGEAAARCMREHLLSVQWRASAKSDEAALRHE
ncbi:MULTISPECIES: FadR/GntR family transcriptional regulator [Paraburkholderia]|jgi:GntR family transcriptional repressor for pyruvate dehydrogenase complex|uniref:Transcriptional regulator, GntR family n=2 Tax=Paraburkholderia aspalathi TaxID=1324617 RepID=A0A1I7E6Z5_9BURK|nr:MULTISPECIES: FCD domain-containing protein [Paraburkholderia]MCP2088745.1 DNA-binding FadR family transcriptional regulator [Paraburkholderia sediminicola]MCX4136638.1 FCD domain-containing protein [Paraburkholderia aspalathi]MCX4152506.1 FCD domain-containing protein [Paraburkholderia aspalathi]MDN7161921.1 FCD domain-containing protein [Paraburkholderia sp. SECH2]MDN7169330.1 FCD domain-containing protein [Paraburkholderia sp. SEWSISQ10-3 4]